MSDTSSLGSGWYTQPGPWGRGVQYLSPSSLGQWEGGFTGGDDRDVWVLRYLCGVRDGQTVPMAIGSVFDALVKEKLTGERWLERQVEVVGDDLRVAVAEGTTCWDWYYRNGGWADLLEVIGGRDVRCEDRVQRVVDCGGVEVPLLGIPDLVCAEGRGLEWTVLDWKVNGILSSASPAAGYIDRWIDPSAKRRSGHRVGHDSAVVGVRGGLRVNIAEGYVAGWADQLGTYMAVSGIDAGVAVVHQLTGRRGKAGPSVLTLTRHGWEVGSREMDALLSRYAGVWECLLGGHVYTDLSVEESRSRVDRLIAGSTNLDAAYKACIS